MNSEFGNSSRLFAGTSRLRRVFLHSFAFPLVCVPILAAHAKAQEVRVYPADYVYSYPVDQQHGLYSVMVQNVAVWSQDASWTIEAIDL